MLLGALIAAAAVTMAEPRAYGHGIGDLLERRATIELQAGAAIAPASLPRRGRVDVWLELREVELRTPRELRLVYQIVNTPKTVATIELPALTLASSSNEPIEIEAWPVTVSAMTPAFALARAGLDEMQPDIAPQREPLAPTLWRLAGCALLLAASLYALALRRHPQLAFWRRDAPFAAAWRELRRLSRRGDADAARAAMARLHAAFDAAAGQAVFAERLEPLYAARPALNALQGDIERFFTRSRSAFFDAEAAETAALPELLALARRLARAEAAAR
jgi:mxaA protein